MLADDGRDDEMEEYYLLWFDVERMAEEIEEKIVRCKSEPGLMQIGRLVSD